MNRPLAICLLLAIGAVTIVAACAYTIIARGHDPRYLHSYSVKKLDQEEID